MDQCDVLIVGGGPAGSSLAWALRNNGLDVLIMDKQNFPRNKICAGWITPAVIDELRIDIDDYGRQHTLQPIHGFLLGQIKNSMNEVHYTGKPVSYGIRRCEFDHYLLKRSNARLRLGEAFNKLTTDGQYWIVNDQIRASLIVGAGGHFCPVARSFAAGTEKNGKKVVAQESEFKLTPEQMAECKASPDVPELYFCEDLQGYGWVFRKGEYINIGLGRDDTHNLSGHVEAFSHYLQEQGRIPHHLTEKFNGHAYLLYEQSTRPLVSDRMLLIGDAAGLAYTQSGEGIRPAIESGLLAAKVIKEADGNYSRENLSQYQKLITRRFGKKKGENNTHIRLPAWIRTAFAGKLLAMRWFTRNIVLNQWFLHTEQAPLADV
ncbi:MAG: geranylgeranyl reductase [Gammaproteobacteria bacterium RIFCSPLOWO2_12_47_11]|nr:MAG: geranylgeranyl reductase [Gammaproteobacteria bacterium RIFCSPLOWO2_12_47_11]